MTVKRLVEILESGSYVDPVALRAAKMENERWGNDIIRSLIDKCAISEEKLLEVLSKLWGAPAVDLSGYKASVSVVERLSSDVADRYRAIPLRVEGSFIDIAFADPTADAIDAMQSHTQLNVRAHVASPKAIDRLLGQCYGRMNIGGYEVDPRVTSGNFLSSDVLDFETGEASMSIPVDLTGFDDEPSMRAAQGQGPAALQAQVEILKQALARADQRIQLLEAHVSRDEDVLRRLFGFLVDKGIGTREEIVNLLN